MVSATINDRLFRLTAKKDIEQSILSILPEYINLKIYYIRQEILRYETKWNMTYKEFESKSTELPDGFSQELEQEYYDWGEKVALLEYYQKLREEWS